MIGEDKIKNIPVFSGCSVSTINQIMLIGHINSYEKNMHICYDKLPIDTVEIILSGAACVYKLNEQGQKRNIFLLHEGKVVNESFAPGSYHSASVQAYMKTKTLSIPIKDFMLIMQGDFTVANNILEIQSLRIKRLYRQMKNLNTNIKLERRIASKIWRMLRDFGGCPDNGMYIVPIKVSTVFFADMLGVQRESVSRALAKLSSEGIISYDYGRLVVYSRDKLVDFIRNS